MSLGSGVISNTDFPTAKNLHSKFLDEDPAGEVVFLREDWLPLKVELEELPERFDVLKYELAIENLLKMILLHMNSKQAKEALHLWVSVTEYVLVFEAKHARMISIALAEYKRLDIPQLTYRDYYRIYETFCSTISALRRFQQEFPPQISHLRFTLLKHDELLKQSFFEFSIEIRLLSNIHDHLSRLREVSRVTSGSLETSRLIYDETNKMSYENLQQIRTAAKTILSEAQNKLENVDDRISEYMELIGIVKDTEKMTHRTELRWQPSEAETKLGMDVLALAARSAQFTGLETTDLGYSRSMLANTMTADSLVGYYHPELGIIRELDDSFYMEIPIKMLDLIVFDDILARRADLGQRSSNRRNTVDYWFNHEYPGQYRSLRDVPDRYFKNMLGKFTDKEELPSEYEGRAEQVFVKNANRDLSPMRPYRLYSDVDLSTCELLLE